MKKLFTLVALLACVLGAKADWVTDYEVDYSTSKGFPFYVMGFVPEWVDGVMTDYGAMYSYKTDEDMEKDDALAEGDEEVGTVTTNNGTVYHKIKLATAGWHQYFIADGVSTELDGSYKVTAMVKASEATSLEIHMGWGEWWNGSVVNATAQVGTEWAEVEWEFSGIGGTSCSIDAKPGSSTATIEWKWLKVTHNQKPTRPVTWQECLTSDGQPVIVETTVDKIANWMGNAETPWGDLKDVKFNDQEKNFLVCAWSKEKGVNLNDEDGWDPFPATIEADPSNPSNHVFVVHGKAATTEGDAAAWDNQFWIQSPKAWKEGTKVKLHFRYKASQTVKTNTQIHKQNPSDYLIWHAVGDVTFTEEWQDFDKEFSFESDMANGWSIAFNLNPEVKDAVDFYFDDLSWQIMKLDEGYFVAGSNPDAGIEYDLDNAIEFQGNNGVYTATVGEKNAYVSQIMISTVRGENAAFKGATLKPASVVVDKWVDYSEAGLAKLNLPGVGIWKITIREANGKMRIELVEGDLKEVKEINPNPTKVVVEGTEREYTKDEAPEGYEFKKNENDEPIYGFPWDNQFCIKANRALSAGESITVSFKYKATNPATVNTQIGNDGLGAWMQGEALGNIDFTAEEQSFTKTFKATEGMQTITFNMAVIKEANTYEVYDIVWKLEDGTESLIDETGSKNLFVKVAAGSFSQVGAETAIKSVNVAKKAVPAGKFNIAGQRVSNNYKGVVVESGRLYLIK